MVNIKKFAVIILLTTLFFSSFASTDRSVLKGKVVDDSKGPIPGVNILIKGTKRGATTDAKGEFRLDVSKLRKIKLIITHIGYKKLEKEVGSSGEIVVRLLPKLINFDEVCVTATKTERTLKEVPVLTRIVSTKEIESSGGVTANEVLDELPGIYFSPDSHGANVITRGLGPKYVLFLVDGERIAGEVKGNIDFSRLNNSSIKKIEIIKGASSSLYGSNAIGGVVNIITRECQKPFEAKLMSRFSHYGEQFWNANVGFKCSGFSGRTDFTRKSGDGYDLDPTTVPRTVEEYEDFTVSQKLGWDYGKKLKTRFRASYYQRERFDESSKYFFKHKFYEDVIFSGKTDYQLTKGVSLQGKWHFDRYESFYILEKLDDKKDKDYRHEFQTASLHFNYEKLARHVLIFGGEWNGDKVFAKRIEGKNKDADNYVVFGQDEFKIRKNMELVSGFRLNRHSEYGSFFSPKVSGLYRVSSFIFRGTFAIGYKAPTLKELYLNWDHGGGGPYVYGNSELEPETARHYSLSGEYRFSDGALSLSFYHNDLKDMIATRSEKGDPNVNHYYNVDEAFTRGFDLNFEKEALYGLSLGGGYSYTDTEDKKTGKELWGRATHTGMIKAFYISSKGLNCRLVGKYVGKRTMDEYEDEETGKTMKEEQSGYFIWNYNVSFAFLKHVKIRGGVNNLFDYTDKDYLITPGRHYFVTLELNY